MPELLQLYLTFARIGLVNFGGGYAMLPLLERELVNDRGWCTTDELMDYFAIGQCTSAHPASLPSTSRLS